ncbi:hypothetical protein DFH08DRAFT_837070 [Mycena albidolilacea]|uniref:Uncharacterized protein n=1 Tax=Mycena albidolilacea TaxID=1033008 RepID=A0AAD7ASS2_9AGAR|nr:hypothetical protein DFH08DRAFT_837070 [Mycena albidolilacea]
MFSENPASTNAPAMPEQNQAPHAAAVTEQNSAEPPIVPFKERVIGVAKKTRGTVLGKPELKEHGEKILQGEASIHDINEPRST